jgi:hypothetical protein
MATTLTGTRTLKLFAEPPFDAQQLRQTYECRAFHSERGEFAAGHGVSTIHLEGGRLQVDDLPILRPSLSHEAISWCQQTEGRFSSGHLHFDKGGTELHGVVHVGTTSADAEAHHVLATTIRPVAYKTRVTKHREPDGTNPSSVPAGDWQDGLVLKVGYEQKVGQPAPTPVVILDDQDISEMTSWTIDPKTQATVLLLSLNASVVCDFDDALYVNGQVAFDQLVPIPTFSGTVTATCSDPSGSGSYLWTGTATATEGNGATVGIVSRRAPIALTHADLIEDSSLTVAELMSIVPDSTVNDEANAMIVENMKWAFSQSGDESGWVGEFFGEQPPVLDPTRQALVQKNIGWYQSDFGKSYLGWSFANYAGPNAPSVQLNSDQKLQLKYFLQTGMAKEPDFSTQQNGVYLQAFVAAKPRIQAYISDGGEKWAQQLYNVITSPAQLILMVNRIWGAAGQPGTLTPANNFATLLSALQGTSGPLAGQYMHAVMAAALSNGAHQTTWTDKDTVMEWLPDFLQTLLTQIAQSGTVPDEAKLLAQQVAELQQQMGGSLSAVAEEIANFVINANGANILQKTQNAQSAFLQKFPKFGAIANGMFFMAWCGGIYMVVKAFQNWKNLTPEDKAKAILSTVQLGLSAIDVVPTMLSGIKKMGLDGWNKFQEWRSGSGANENVQNINEAGDIGEDWVKVGADETTPLFDTATNTVKAEGTLWESIFEGAGKVVAVIGVAVSAAFAVLSTIDFVEDIESGQPISKTVVDGVMAAANIGMTVCLVLDMVVATTVFAMAAAVFAVIGIIVAIVAMFVIKPKNPLDEFMDSTIIPFVKGLPPQTPPPTPGGATVQYA